MDTPTEKHRITRGVTIHINTEIYPKCSGRQPDMPGVSAPKEEAQKQLIWYKDVYETAQEVDAVAWQEYRLLVRNRSKEFMSASLQKAGYTNYGIGFIQCINC